MRLRIAEIEACVISSENKTRYFKFLENAFARTA